MIYIYRKCNELTATNSPPGPCRQSIQPCDIKDTSKHYYKYKDKKKRQKQHNLQENIIMTNW